MPGRCNVFVESDFWYVIHWLFSLLFNRVCGHEDGTFLYLLAFVNYILFFSSNVVMAVAARLIINFEGKKPTSYTLISYKGKISVLKIEFDLIKMYHLTLVSILRAMY